MLLDHEMLPSTLKSKHQDACVSSCACNEWRRSVRSCRRRSTGSRSNWPTRVGSSSRYAPTRYSPCATLRHLPQLHLLLRHLRPASPHLPTQFHLSHRPTQLHFPCYLLPGQAGTGYPFLHPGSPSSHPGSSHPYASSCTLQVSAQLYI